MALGGGLLVLRLLPRLPFGRRLVLSTALEASTTEPPPSGAPRVGRHGTAVTPLRPAGIATIDGARVDVVSDGDYIASGEPVVVTRLEGNRVVVRRPARPAEEE
jgi:membrane-bound serine protease (ClpP class)